jgi:hypothetical protein
LRQTPCHVENNSALLQVDGAIVFKPKMCHVRGDILIKLSHTTSLGGHKKACKVGLSAVAYVLIMAFYYTSH